MEPTGLSVRGGVIDFIMFINGYLIVCLDLLWRVCHIGYMILVDFLSFIDTFIMNINVIVYYCYQGLIMMRQVQIVVCYYSSIFAILSILIFYNMSILAVQIIVVVFVSVVSVLIVVIAVVMIIYSSNFSILLALIIHIYFSLISIIIHLLYHQYVGNMCYICQIVMIYYYNMRQYYIYWIQVVIQISMLLKKITPMNLYIIIIIFIYF